MDRARPALRCLREDLNPTLPPLTEPLDKTDHPLLAKAAAQFAGEADGGGGGVGHERIRAVEDQVLFKVKVQRWRGAVWINEPCPWLVAAGVREEGSGEDFYVALEADARTARATYNASHARPLTTRTHVGQLLPDRDDHLRYGLDEGTRFIRRLERLIPELVRVSLRDGAEHAAYDIFTLGIQVYPQHDHEVCVAVRVTGSVPPELLHAVLDIVPGCDHGGWFPETALPERDLLPAEQAWSNLMEAKTARTLLEDDPG